MKITLKDLEDDKRVCEEAIDQFREDYPDGIDVPQWLPIHQAILLSSRGKRWWGYAVDIGLIPAWSMRRWFSIGADLQGADLGGADLQDVNLCGANLQGANLCDANLQGANLCDANLQGADLYRADLYRVNLCDANLQGANLCGADLQGTNLQGANLWDAKRFSSDNEIDGWEIKDGLLSKAL